MKHDFGTMNREGTTTRQIQDKQVVSNKSGVVSLDSGVKDDPFPNSKGVGHEKGVTGRDLSVTPTFLQDHFPSSSSDFWKTRVHTLILGPEVGRVSTGRSCSTPMRSVVRR